jgi:putative FmdB family regulatory protein
MPRYDYRCRACGATFEVTRSLADSSGSASCPAGHEDTVKLLSTVALTGRSGSAGGTRAAAPSPGGAGGGCCGGACGC